MSFYGNVTYYLSNAFNKIIYRNEHSKSGKQGSTDGHDSPGTPSYEYALSPRSRKDETILETGNKWIVFADPRSTVGNNQIQIFHQTVREDQQDASLAPFTRAAQTSTDPETGQTTTETATSLNWGAIVGIPSITYDNAGHIVNGGVTKFKMPVPSSETALNSIKTRLSQLEEYLTGEHNPDDGGGEITPVETDNAYAERIRKLEEKTNDWNMGNGSRELEPSGIGTTFHEFMVDFGVRKKTTNSDGKTVYRTLEENEDYADYSYIKRISDSYNSARTAQEYSTNNRIKLNEIIQFLNNRFEAGIGTLREY